MKQIYDFECSNPPIINENMLRKKIEKQRVQWQTLLLAIASVLLQAAIIMLGIISVQSYPVIAGGCALYIIASTIGSGAIAVVCVKRRRAFS